MSGARAPPEADQGGETVIRHTVLVSLEPFGGPPTGPVLYGGTLTVVN